MSKAKAGPALFRASHLRVGIEAVLVIALGLQTARLAWIFLAPPPLPPAAQASAGGPRGADTAILGRVNPFEGGGTGAAPIAPSAAAGDLTLHGVRTGAAGSAIIAVAGAPQRSVAVGEEIAPGVVLSSVHADHVMVSRGGAAARLDLTSAAPGASSVMSAPPPPAAAGPATPASAALAVDPARLLAETGLRPRSQNGQVIGYSVVSRGALPGQLGLAAGDIITAVNGARLTPELYSRLSEELAAESNIQLTVQRGSQTRTITLSTAR